MQKVYNDKNAHVKKLKTCVKLQVWNKKNNDTLTQDVTQKKMMNRFHVCR